MVDPAAAPKPTKPCPDDMVYVDTTYCSEIERTCVEPEHEPINHLLICHKFADEQRCVGTEERRRFCIDKYEYPNKEGAHPVWMVNWAQAQATCKSKGKRLCWSSEWTAACEGPEHTPFPYGRARDHHQCNVDNMYIEPKRSKGRLAMYSLDPREAFAELSRLDQSVPSGSMTGCVSGFGVRDMTGNLDEWVTSDEPPREKSEYAGLKGGAWGHVRNACRPMTTSHSPDFWYYFVGFRCCADATGTDAWTPRGEHVAAPEVEAHDFAPDPIVPVDPPGPSKKKHGKGFYAVDSD